MQVHLVEWLKMMVGTRRAEEVVDREMEVKPTIRALKRALLVALRCVDPDSEKRPSMGHVVRMLEAEDVPSREVGTSHPVLLKHVTSEINVIPFPGHISEPCVLTLYFRTGGAGGATPATRTPSPRRARVSSR
jgi:hypothetical protein